MNNHELKQKLRTIQTLAAECLVQLNDIPTKTSAKASSVKSVYSGLTGGVHLLVEEGFFSTKKSLSTVREALDQKGYVYSRQAVHEALKSASRPGGLLVVIKDGKFRLYAERK